MPNGSGPRRPADLLHHPPVAVRVAEGQERVVVGTKWVGSRELGASVPIEVERLSRVEASLRELRARRIDVGNNQLQPLRRTGRVAVLHECDRAGRAAWRQLDHPKVLAGAVVDVEGESGAIDVEGFRS